MKRRPHIFVTDGSYPNALAAVRDLGRSGFEVTVGERQRVSPTSCVAFWSRYCGRQIRYPDPRTSRDLCIDVLAQHFRENDYDAAIPVGLDMVELFVSNRELFRVPMMLPPSDSFRIAGDKRLTFQHAAAAGIPAPCTVAAEHWSRFEPPIVFKHYRTGVRVARTRDEARLIAQQLGEDLSAYIAQRYIPGVNGFGYFGFFENGIEKAHFMHQRVMQFPREGGVSVVARSIRNSRLRELGRSLLESLCWNGPAMVEFKQSDADHEFYLIEINPKLWGSLDLAIQAGCNFPVWIADWLTARRSPPEQSYREGVMYQWVVPNGLKCFFEYPEFRGGFLRNLFTPGIRTDLRWLDPLPALSGLVAMTRNLSRRT